MSNKLFGAPWCGNCNTTKDKFDVMGVQYEYINIDEHHDTAVEHNIRSIPTLITEAGERAVGLVKILELVKSNDNLPSN
ncbi:Thioredoxin [compost metagenome]